MKRLTTGVNHKRTLKTKHCARTWIHSEWISGEIEKEEHFMFLDDSCWWSSRENLECLSSSTIWKFSSDNYCSELVAAAVDEELNEWELITKDERLIYQTDEWSRGRKLRSWWVMKGLWEGVVRFVKFQICFRTLKINSKYLFINSIPFPCCLKKKTWELKLIWNLIDFIKLLHISHDLAQSFSSLLSSASLWYICSTRESIN